MKKRYLGIYVFVLLAFQLAASCTSIPDKPPRITSGGNYLEDRSTWEKYKFNTHYGIDYYTAPGTPIIAAADGTVINIVDMDRIIPDN